MLLTCLPMTTENSKTVVRICNQESWPEDQHSLQSKTIPQNKTNYNTNKQINPTEISIKILFVLLPAFF